MKIDIEKNDIIFNNINNLEELWNFMKNNIKYGWTNNNHEYRDFDDNRKNDEYFIHSAIETISDGYGICMDQVQLEKEFCEFKKIPYTTISFQFKDDKGNYLNYGHTFIIAYEDGEFKYFERAFAPNANIVGFNTLEEAISKSIAYYIMCFDDLKLQSVDNMLLYINPNYKVGMTTKEIFETELNCNNKINEYIEQIKTIIKELS